MVFPTKINKMLKPEYKKLFFLQVILLFFLLFPLASFAYPDTDLVFSGGPPFSFSIASSVTDAVLQSDRTMMISYAESLKLIDMGKFALYDDQPPALSKDDGTDGNIMGLAYDSRNRKIYASQDDGDLLIYTMDDITALPISIEISAGSSLGPVVLNDDGTIALIADNTMRNVHRYDYLQNKVTATIPITIQDKTGYTITDAVYVKEVNGAYFTTNVGALFFIPDSAIEAQMINIGISSELNLVSIASDPNGNNIYIVDQTSKYLVHVNPSNNSIVKSDIDISLNSNPTSVVVTEVSNPIGGGTGAIYAYAAGIGGLSIVNTPNDQVFDLGTDPTKDKEPLPTTVTPNLLMASSKSDGYLYSINADLTVGVFTANPWITITSGSTYSGGDSKLGLGESFDIIFKSDTAGTYEVRSNGDVNASGSLMTDSNGNTSGAALADTDITLTFNYADNSTSFIEGNNSIFFFVTDSTTTVAERGRRATTLVVDTPPPAVTINSTDYGYQRVYINFNRLTEADMSSYNIYTDTDPAIVLTKTDVSSTVSQPSSGTTVEASVSGLTNGLLYYIAMDAVDEAGNVSLTRTGTLSSGVAASATPQRTLGPAGGAGEKGCTLNQLVVNKCVVHSGLSIGVILIALIVLLHKRLKSFQKKSFLFLIVTFSILISSTSFAIDKDNHTYGFEIKSGLWMPVSNESREYFGQYTNVITRLDFTYLYKRKYGIQAGSGIFWKSGIARGEIDHTRSRDHYDFFAFPFEINALWRLDYLGVRYFIPFIKGGFGGVIYHERTTSGSITGHKMGLQGGGGTLLSLVGSDSDFDVEDVFFVIEVQYNWIDDFGRKGLNLSGPLYSVGFMVEF
ncbi:MAG: hypothetical protein ABIE74_06535 [Pseudomonadota bacterium]